MRVCIVGCGAVGSLFAANLANLDDVEVWAYDLSQRARRRDQRERAAALGRGRGRRAGVRDHERRGRAAAVRLRDRRDEGDAHRAGDRRDGARVRRRGGRLGPERDRQRGDARRARRARDPRHDLPRRPDPRARPRAVGRQGRHDDSAPSSRARRRSTRSSASPRRAPAPACPTDGGRRRPRPAVAQADLQRGHQPGRRADRPDARARLRGPGAARGSSPGSSTRARRSRARRGSCSTPTRRS